MLSRVEGTAGQCPVASKGKSFWVLQKERSALFISCKGAYLISAPTGKPTFVIEHSLSFITVTVLYCHVSLLTSQHV